MKQPFQIILITLLSIAYVPNLLFGQLYEVSLDEKIQKSTLIVEGKVVESRCYRADDANIYTANKIKLSALRKGEYRDEYLTITTWGGELDGELQTWTHLLTLNQGEKGLFFLEPTRVPAIKDADYPASFDVYSASQGFIQFVQNDAKAWIGREPFHTYEDIPNDLYAYIAQQTGQKGSPLGDGGDEKRSGIRYHFTDIGFQGNTVTFNIYVNSLQGNKKLHKSGIQLGYNPAFFGSNIATNGNLLLQDAGISQSSTYDLTQSNVTSSTVKIELVPVGNLNGLTEITTSEQLLAKGKITIQNLLADPGIIYDIAAMQAMSKFYEGGLQQVFDTVIVEGDWRPFEQFAPQIKNISPLSLRAGTDDILIITGTGFGSTQGNSYVQFTNAHAGITNGVNWIKPLPGDYPFWSENEIRVVVPGIGLGDNGLGDEAEYAGTGKVRVRVGSGSPVTSSQSLTVRLAADNRALVENGTLVRKKVRLVGDFSENIFGYTLYYDDQFKNLSGATDAFERALCTWTQSSNINFRIKKFSTIDPLYQQYACKITLTNSLPAGVSSSIKANTTKDYSDCPGTNGIDIKFLKKFDMYFRENADWYTDSNFDPTQPNSYWESRSDLEALYLHELGHAQLLKHVNQVDDVMYYEVLGPKRILMNGDVEGGNYIKEISIAPLPNSCNNYSPIGTNSDCSLNPTIETITEAYNLSPNPSSEFIICKFATSGKFLGEVFDPYGRLVLSEKFFGNEFTFDVSQLHQSFYILKITDSDHKSV